MNLQKHAVTVVAAVGILALLAGVGLPGTTASGSHQSHHPQALEAKAPADAGCPAHSRMAGGMMSGMMSGMMGSGMHHGMECTGNTSSGCGTPACANRSASPQAPCDHDAAHGCVGGKSTS